MSNPDPRRGDEFGDPDTEPSPEPDDNSELGDEPVIPNEGDGEAPPDDEDPMPRGQHEPSVDLVEG